MIVLYLTYNKFFSTLSSLPSLSCYKSNRINFYYFDNATNFCVHVGMQRRESESLVEMLETSLPFMFKYHAHIDQ